MIRTILIALTLFLYLVLLLPVLGIEWLYHKISPQKADYQQLHMVQAAFRLMLKMTGAQIQVIGEENVPTDRAVLYVGNHKSYFDILLTYSRVPRLTGYVAKKEMESFPILSIWMKRLHCLFLDRKDIKQGLKTILAGIDLIKNGISVCIFPEGTRNKSADRMLPFKEGSLKIAEKTGCPIIPFAITNSSKLFEDHMPFVRPCQIIIEYGKPIYPAELPKEEKKFLGAYCRKQIEDMLISHEA